MKECHMYVVVSYTTIVHLYLGAVSINHARKLLAAMDMAAQELGLAVPLNYDHPGVVSLLLTVYAMPKATHISISKLPQRKHDSVYIFIYQWLVTTNLQLQLSQNHGMICMKRTATVAVTAVTAVTVVACSQCDISFSSPR
jgi:hypothetical protein